MHHLETFFPLHASVSWISIDGVTYKPEKCFVRTNFINTHPYFGLLYKILYFEENPVFVCKTVHTVEHDLHFNSYEISINEEFKMYNLNELFVHTVYHSHKVDGKYYIVVKRSVGDIH